MINITNFIGENQTFIEIQCARTGETGVFFLKQGGERAVGNNKKL